MWWFGARRRCRKRCASCWETIQRSSSRHEPGVATAPVGHRRGLLQVGADEVSGNVSNGRSREADPLAPRSPYSATKAGAEMLVNAYHESFGVPTLVTRGSNTYGPYQFPEKIIPLFITNALQDLPLPIYGDGSAVRDYLYVDDHVRAIATVLSNGDPG